MLQLRALQLSDRWAPAVLRATKALAKPVQIACGFGVRAAAKPMQIANGPHHDKIARATAGVHCAPLRGARTAAARSCSQARRDGNCCIRVTPRHRRRRDDADERSEHEIGARRRAARVRGPDETLRRLDFPARRRGGWLHPTPSIFTLRENVNIRIEKDDNDEESDIPFNEEWATGFPDKSTHRVHYDVYFGASLIDSFMLVGVDGLRAQIPPPKIGTKVINYRRYRLALAVDVQNSLDEHIELAGLTVADADAPADPWD